MELTHLSAVTASAKKARKRVHEVLEVGNPDDFASRLVDYLLMAAILISVIAIVLESVSSLATRYQPVFDLIHVGSILIFTFEYILRVWSCVESDCKKFHAAVKGRLRFMVSPLALVDLVAILPVYIVMFVTVDLRFLRVIRLLRLLKLARYSPAIGILWRVVNKERQAINAAFFFLLIVLIFASSGIFLFEQNAQPDVFTSIPAAMWWAVATVTTVGYGDITPITNGGKLFGACISVIGIGMVAIPTGILVSGFSEEIRKRRQSYGNLLDEVLEDGMVTAAERHTMESTRQQIGLSEEEAGLIFREALKAHRRLDNCPNCGHSVHLKTSDPDHSIEKSSP